MNNIKYLKKFNTSKIYIYKLNTIKLLKTNPKKINYRKLLNYLIIYIIKVEIVFCYSSL